MLGEVFAHVKHSVGLRSRSVDEQVHGWLGNWLLVYAMTFLLDASLVFSKASH